MMPEGYFTEKSVWFEPLALSAKDLRDLQIAFPVLIQHSMH